MTEPLTVVFVLMGVIAITAVVFGIWFVVMLIKLVGRGIGAVFGGSPMPQAISSPTMQCPRGGCRAINPSSAHFCRRCGQELLKRQIARQAAIW